MGFLIEKIYKNAIEYAQEKEHTDIVYLLKGDESQKFGFFKS